MFYYIRGGKVKYEHLPARMVLRAPISEGHYSTFHNCNND